MKKSILPLVLALCVLSSTAYASITQLNDSTSTNSTDNGSGTGTSGGTDSSGNSGGSSYR